jgi:hypothetical protein
MCLSIYLLFNTQSHYVAMLALNSQPYFGLLRIGITNIYVTSLASSLVTRYYLPQISITSKILRFS